MPTPLQNAELPIPEQNEIYMHNLLGIKKQEETVNKFEFPPEIINVPPAQYEYCKDYYAEKIMHCESIDSAKFFLNEFHTEALKIFAEFLTDPVNKKA